MVSNVTASNSSAVTLPDKPYMDSASSTFFGTLFQENTTQFATLTTAQEIAGILGGKVVDMSGDWSGGTQTTQYGIQLTDGGPVLNAGLIASRCAACGVEAGLSAALVEAGSLTGKTVSYGDAMTEVRAGEQTYLASLATSASPTTASSSSSSKTSTIAAAASTTAASTTAASTTSAATTSSTSSTASTAADASAISLTGTPSTDSGSTQAATTSSAASTTSSASTTTTSATAAPTSAATTTSASTTDTDNSSDTSDTTTSDTTTASPTSNAAATNTTTTTAAASDDAKLAKAAKDFEALMISTMLKSVRESTSGGWLGSSDDSSSVSAVELAEGQLAQNLADQGGLGLADMVLKGLQRSATTPNSAQQS